MSAIPNQGFPLPNQPNVPFEAANQHPLPNNSGTRNSFVFGSNMSIGGDVSITVTDNSQLITGDNMQVHVVSRSNPTVKPPQDVTSKI